MFRASSYKDFSNIVPKPDHIADLERRQQALEDEIEEAMLHCSTDDLMIVDLKRRKLTSETRSNGFVLKKPKAHAYINVYLTMR